MKRYFAKEIVSQPFYLPTGKALAFERSTQRGKGIFSTEDEMLGAILSQAARKRMGGIIEIDQNEYEGLVSGNGHADGNGTPDRIPEAVEGRMSSEPGLLCEGKFYHSGDLGDVIYSLPTVRDLGGGVMVLGPDNRSGMPTRETMTPARFALLAPLLAHQSYIQRVEYSPTLPGEGVSDLNLFRREFFRNGRIDVAPGMNLARVHLKAFDLRLEADSEAWLTIDSPLALPGKAVVFARSQRYHNPRFNWREVVRRYGAQAVFLGTEGEWRDFCRSYGPVDYHPTKDLLEVARVIAGAKLMVANQSAPYAIAEGLKQNTILEVSLEAPNCIFARANAWHVARTPFLLPRLEELPGAAAKLIEFNENYFMRGQELGLSNYTNYSWLEEITHDLAKAIARHLQIRKGQTVLDYGCARGYLVRALREIGYEASGCDISEWAVQNCDETVRDRIRLARDVGEARFDWVISKDVLVHVPKEGLQETAAGLLKRANHGAFFVVPLTNHDGGQYICPRDNADVSHLIRWTLPTWLKFLRRCSPDFTYEGSFHLPGIKQASEPYEGSCGFITAKRIGKE